MRRALRSAAALVCLTGCVKSTASAAGAEPVPPVGQAQYLIHKTPAEVFEAIVNPALTTKFWFVNASGRLEPGKEVRWEFPGNVTAQVAVRAFEPNRRLVMEWWSEGQPPTTVEWLLTPKGESATLLGAIHSGFQGEPAVAAGRALDSTAGFTSVLAGMKVFLEEGLQLNLVADSIECLKAAKARPDATAGRASLLIRKPAAEVFEAIVDPAITTKFWFVEGSERLGPAKQVSWVFPGQVTAQVAVRAFEPNRRVVFEWWFGDQRPAPVEWVFTPDGEDATCVSVTSSGFTGDPASIVDQANHSTGGFTFVLTQLKAFLEHDLKLNPMEFSERVKR
jgi:uncharacterized protein YndB with AHSA1/START domain